ncbi:cytochrome P450 18a1 [Trichonephila clavipes]|uniref:Cytochrome P450 18a1 n=1 Tax=Trichonephila clavipes TaxID=2585209 RepID=A0A8X6V9D2_TRICX|nr:cytochrome P450 18a1 [Trichonephila clavipes]
MLRLKCPPVGVVRKSGEGFQLRCRPRHFTVAQNYKPGITPPGPRGWPIVGYIPYMSSKPYLDFQKLAKIYGPVFSLQLGSQYVVVLNDFQSTKDAFAQDAFMGRPPESPFDVSEESLETQAFIGLPWKEQRRFSLHILKDLGFGKSKLDDMIKVFRFYFLTKNESHDENIC